MATVGELSDPYANFMLNPLPPSAEEACSVCLTFTEGYDTCYACGHQHNFLDAVLPISYSVHHGQLHHALAGYKRSYGAAALQLQLGLAAVLWRFLAGHEACLARQAGVEAFDRVATVPSSSIEHDAIHPLRTIVGERVRPTADRFERLLRRSDLDVSPRHVEPGKYDPTRALTGEAVLLIDDTWTTGSNIQSAAGALKAAGAGRVGALVIGRHVREEFGKNATRVKALDRPFDWKRCALH